MAGGAVLCCGRRIISARFRVEAVTTIDPYEVAMGEDRKPLPTTR